MFCFGKRASETQDSGLQNGQNSILIKLGSDAKISNYPSPDHVVFSVNVGSYSKKLHVKFKMTLKHEICNKATPFADIWIGNSPNNLFCASKRGI